MERLAVKCRRFETGSRWLPVLLAAAALTTLRSQPVAAAGQEHHSRGDDLIVTVDTRWAGCAHGGYYPIRIRAENRGPSRVFTFRFAPEPADGIPTVVRTIEIDQNAAVEFSLAVPMAGHRSYGTFHIVHERRILDLHTKRLQLADVEPFDVTRPSMIVISSAQIEYGPFVQAVNAHLAAIRGFRHSTAIHTGTGINCETVSHTLLPESWLDYSGVDIVSVSVSTLESLEPARRDAILKWVQCGGTLLVYDVEDLSAGQNRVSEILRLNDFHAASVGWQPPRVPRPALTHAADSRTLHRNASQSAPEADAGGPEDGRPTAAGENVPDGATAIGAAAADVTNPPAPFAHRPLLLGTVYLFHGNPFPGTVADWAWILADGGLESKQWTERMGISSRLSNPDFLQFLIPGVRGVPIYAFLVLMTLFTIAIGPLNYYLLWKRKQLHLLVVTVPAIAFVTSASLLAYSALAHGFGVKSRMRSLTLLDQGAHTAVSSCRLALYAGLTPSRGLRFSPETAVFPIWPASNGFRSGTVDWTQAQALESGWLRSRTHTQFLTLTHRGERGRIEIGAPAEGRINVANGLEWHVQSLLVADPSGSLYVGNDLPPGSQTTLQSATPDAARAFVQLLDRNPLREPMLESTDYVSEFLLPLNLYYSAPDWKSNTSFARNVMESRLLQIRQDVRKGQLAGRTYVAVLQENPNIETGVGAADERAGYHVLVGYY